MRIECIAPIPGEVTTPIGNESYTFRPDEHGRRCAEVWVQDHIDCFLALPHLYREAKDDPEGERVGFDLSLKVDEPPRGIQHVTRDAVQPPRFFDADGNVKPKRGKRGRPSKFSRKA